MIGGKIHTVFMFDDRLSLLVQGTGCESNDRLVIDVPLDVALHGIASGDSVWWQSDIALWTPQNNVAEDEDIHIPRIGYSYSPDYLWPKVARLCRGGICPECAFDNCMADGEGSLWCARCGASYKLNDVEVEA